MKTVVMLSVFVLATTTSAGAKGCLTGALAGGAAGHYIHHTLTGALAGCYMGHHIAHQKQQQGSQEKTPSAPKDAGSRGY